jgi:hypothetical protein
MTDDDVAGERALIWALVETALQDALCLSSPSLCGSRQIAKRKALKWLLSNSTAPFSFLWIAQILDISVDAIRKEVIRYSPTIAPTGTLVGRRKTLSKPFDVTDMLSTRYDDNYSNVIYFE